MDWKIILVGVIGDSGTVRPHEAAEALKTLAESMGADVRQVHVIDLSMNPDADEAAR